MQSVLLLHTWEVCSNVCSNIIISVLRVTCFHDCTEAHAALWPAMPCVWKLFHDIKAKMFFLPLAESEDRDRWAPRLERPPGCIHPNRSESHSPLSLPSDQALPVETLSCKVRGHTNSPTPSSFFYTSSSISVHHTLFSSSLFSIFLPLSVTLWPIDLTEGEIISWSTLPQLSGPYTDCIIILSTHW